VTKEDRQKLVDFHLTFDDKAEGARVLAHLRRELYDIPSAFARGRDGKLVMVDQRSTDVNEGRRAAFMHILGYLEAYDSLTKEGG